MANIKSSKKDAIASEKRKRTNNKKRSRIKTYIKRVLFYISKNNFNKAMFSFIQMQSILDKYSLQGIIHKNKVARYKSNLLIKIKKINENN
ncbi:MAG: 30S ribosomal protein S20 [Buchnera aphidicola (Periphyllus acericola)]|uniref:30S ribosomal protein S20 n=1 Tax=Buchnera aphidicola TaxID=9 RepID=UPI0030CF3019|nr:30S ribosomal protein S20 [Buchnera aphidicola (Periphyllus acericola)]